MLAAALDMPPWNLWPELFKATEPIVRDVVITVLILAVLFLPSREGTVHRSVVHLIRELKAGSIRAFGIEIKVNDVFEEKFREHELALDLGITEPFGPAKRNEEPADRMHAASKSDRPPPNRGISQNIVERRSPPKKSGRGMLILFGKNEKG